MSTNNKIISYKDLQFAILYDAQTISHTVKSIADKINAHYRSLLQDDPDPSVVVICVLKGAFMFFTDLIRHFDFRVEEDFIRLSSYHGGMASTH
jgi:hypoxanthine phosphoribosyltransferase